MLPIKDAILFPRQTLNYINECVALGEGILKQEPTYNQIGPSINYLMGDQLSERPKTLSHIVDNRTKKAVSETVSALTDIHPLFGFDSENDYFQDQVVILGKLTRAWWTNSFADLYLADVIRYAMAAGTGYCEVNWDRTLAGGQGDLILTPVDPRDVIPINPRFNFSIQSWDGVIIRSMETVDTLYARYGIAAAGLQADTGSSWLSRLWGSLSTKMETPSNIFESMGRKAHNQPLKVSAKETFKTYLKDNRLWTGTEPITMGDVNTTWSYIVYPVGYQMPNGEVATEADARVYPRGRLIVSTKDRVLYDGPNPYWHGMFPIAKLTLDPWPWSLLGGSLVTDLRPMQDAVNECLNGMWDYVKKVLRPAITGDKRAVPASQWNRIDTRVAGQKIQQNPTAGKQIEFVKNDPMPAEVMEFFQYVCGEMDNLSGVANLQALMQLNQAPGADSIEKMQEALSPILRTKSRLLEVFLREIGEMVKAGFFQFYTVARRVNILGEQGISMHEFDYNPGSLVPSIAEGQPGYVPALDARLPTAQRAQQHMRNFTFQITPNSLLSISQLSRKLTYMQLFKLQIMDPYSVLEAMEIPNGGQPPSGIDTVIDRIIYARSVGLMPPMPGQQIGPGQPPSFQAPPQMIETTDPNGLPRTTTTTS